MQSYFYFIQYYYTAYEITLEVKKKQISNVSHQKDWQDNVALFRMFSSANLVLKKLKLQLR